MRNRIIPARAGSTHLVLLHTHQPQDHPRSRGVHEARRAEKCLDPGSSPLARGPQKKVRADRYRCRIIPARAGSTVVAAGVALYKKDHPRSRGVHKCSSRWMSARSGSSPLARGPRRRCCGTFSGRRIIPARAGSTMDPTPIRFSVQDHPRSRGVHYGFQLLIPRLVGSSPLARGPHTSPKSGSGNPRIIPARAGSTE